MPPGIKAIQDNAGLKPALPNILQNGTTKKSVDIISHCRIANSLIQPPDTQRTLAASIRKDPFHYFQFFPATISDGSFYKKQNHWRKFLNWFIALFPSLATPKRSTSSCVSPIVEIWLPLHIFRDNHDFSHK